MSEARLELFHLLTQPASRRIRRRMGELGLGERLGMRNVAFDSHREALAALGGTEPPAIWDGTRLHEGEMACEAVLARLAFDAAL